MGVALDPRDRPDPTGERGLRPKPQRSPRIDRVAVGAAVGGVNPVMQSWCYDLRKMSEVVQR